MKLSKDLSSIVLDHGTGGLLSQDLVSNIIAPALSNRYLGEMEDSAVLKIDSGEIAMTTDSFVVNPIIFTNGDIGKIAVCGTVNDLAVSGAIPLYLTLGMIIEEGFPMKHLISILQSVKTVAEEANIYIVAGDTKVVKRGEADKIFLNTSGIGLIKQSSQKYSIKNVKPHDDIIVTGYLGNHSIHILSLREGLGYENKVLSDCAPLNQMISEIKYIADDKIHLMRDLTRGGLGSALNEISQAISHEIHIELDKLPIQHETRMASDMLGINPIYLANEGCLCIICDPKVTDAILDSLRGNRYGKKAVKIGSVQENEIYRVIGISGEGNEELIEHLYGRELPRLC